MGAALSTSEALAKLAEDPAREFVELFAHGTLSVEVYRPRGVDRQQPHRRDEVYVVIAGTGELVRAGERRAFGPGEFLFVGAGVEHRFENFSADFSTWVFFHGPDGGE